MDDSIVLQSQVPLSPDCYLDQGHLDSSALGLNELPSPSCSKESEVAEWNVEAYPFDCLTLVESSVNLSRIFSLDNDEGEDKAERVIIETAKECIVKR
ncbi:unnamed protein product [Linum trigynum]|uniref:Uncharacterized protein n=1 Tax=Linum trigynum TaxID=586398 RepID=A0AAV2DWW1_9ROSI